VMEPVEIALKASAMPRPEAAVAELSFDVL
jgi:hypothetical protein